MSKGGVLVMNRPKREGYLMSNDNYSFNYTEALEKYCDELETIYEQKLLELNATKHQLELLGYSLGEKPHWENCEVMSKDEYKEYVFDKIDDKYKLDWLYEMGSELCYLHQKLGINEDE